MPEKIVPYSLCGEIRTQDQDEDPALVIVEEVPGRVSMTDPQLTDYLKLKSCDRVSVLASLFAPGNNNADVINPLLDLIELLVTEHQKNSKVKTIYYLAPEINPPQSAFAIFPNSHERRMITNPLYLPLVKCIPNLRLEFPKPYPVSDRIAQTLEWDCSDWRFQKAFRNWHDQKGRVADSTRIALPGGTVLFDFGIIKPDFYRLATRLLQLVMAAMRTIRGILSPFHEDCAIVKEYYPHMKNTGGTYHDVQFIMKRVADILRAKTGQIVHTGFVPLYEI